MRSCARGWLLSRSPVIIEIMYRNTRMRFRPRTVNFNSKKVCMKRRSIICNERRKLNFNSREGYMKERKERYTFSINERKVNLKMTRVSFKERNKNYKLNFKKR